MCSRCHRAAESGRHNETGVKIEENNREIELDRDPGNENQNPELVIHVN